MTIDPVPSQRRPQAEMARVLQGILENPKAKLSVTSLDIAFLYVLDREMAQDAASSYSFDRMVEVYDYTLALVPGEERSMSRAEARVLDLIDQMILLPARTSLRRREGSYRIGPIGAELRDTYSFVEDAEAERLTAILRQIAILVRGCIHDCEKLGDKADWDAAIREPIAHVAQTFLRALERRQSHIDMAQEATKLRVETLLHRRGSEPAAVERCEDILRATTRTVIELRDTLLSEGGRLNEEIERLANIAMPRHWASLQACQGLMGHVDRLVDWADDRFAQWTAFHSRAAEYIEFVVNIDPDQVIARAMATYVGWLGNQVGHDASGRAQLPFTLLVARTSGYRRLREFPDAERARVVEVTITPHGASEAQDNDIHAALLDLWKAVFQRLTSGETVDLHELLAPFRDWPVSRLSRLAGKLTLAMLELGRAVPAENDQIAVPLRPGLSLDRLRVAPRR